jgi:hypothetical protein
MTKYTHEDVMALLKTVPRVTDHLNQPSVIEAKENAKQEAGPEEPLSDEMGLDEAMDYLDGLIRESEKEKSEK